MIDIEPIYVLYGDLDKGCENDFHGEVGEVKDELVARAAPWGWKAESGKHYCPHHRKKRDRK